PKSASTRATSAPPSRVEDGRLVSVGLHRPSPTRRSSDLAWTVSVAAADLAHAQLPDGSYSVTADVSDLAGNPAAEASRSLVVDETPTSHAGTPVSSAHRITPAASTSHLSIRRATPGDTSG